MPRNMSFAMTTEQFRNRTKTVTRRFGWWFLKPGALVMGVEKSMGLKRGEKIKRLGLIKIVFVEKVPLNLMSSGECYREGFPGYEPYQFVNMMVEKYRCARNAMVNRIEFEYVD